MQTIEELQTQLAQLEESKISLEYNLSHLESKRDNFTDNYDYTEEYEAMLDEVHAEEVESVTFVNLGAPSELLKEHDPVAYRCGYADYADHLDKDSINEYKDILEEIEEVENELEDITDQIESIEEEIEILEEEEE